MYVLLNYCLAASSHLSCGADGESEKLVKRAVKQLFCGVKPTFNNHRRYRAAAAILRRRKTIETVLKRGGTGDSCTNIIINLASHHARNVKIKCYITLVLEPITNYWGSAEGRPPQKLTIWALDST